MPLIAKFEDIVAWQEARCLSQQIYVLSASGDLARDFGLRESDAQGSGFCHDEYRRGL